MKKYLSLLLLTALLALQSCVRVNTVGGSFKRLNVEEFKAFIDSELAAKLVAAVDKLAAMQA